MRVLAPSVCVVLGLMILSCGKIAKTSSVTLEHWNPANEPAILNSSSQGYITRLNQLPLAANLKVKPWSDSYWPSYLGGISARWNTNNPLSFSYTPPTQAELKEMTDAQKATLSPAEKYDILQGRYDYPTVKLERSRTSPTNESWEGICHGWAPAAYLFSEPQPVTKKNSDGMSIPFGSSDVKALLSYYQGQIAKNQPTRFLASRCNIDLSTNPSAANSSECRDINAGSFHIVLANQIMRNQSFVADVTRDLQVWNQPIYGFETQILKELAPSQGAAPGTVKEVVVKTKMIYTVEIEPLWKALNDKQVLKSAIYDYRLELSQSGEILGGEWISNDRPDFAWSQETPKFEGYYGKISELLSTSPVVTPTTIPSPRPTVIPTAAPTAAPTASPVPTVRPTLTPTAPPAVEPTALPLPTRTPLPIGQLKAFCPTGYEAKPIPNSGASYCVNAGKVLTPVSEKMIDECLLAFNEDCYETKWNEATYLKFRGTGFCMPGTKLDLQTGYCSQEDRPGVISVFGPFSKELVERCMKAGGGNACNTVRWDREFMMKLQIR